jgi:hypothetical protein
MKILDELQREEYSLRSDYMEMMIQVLFLSPSPSRLIPSVLPLLLGPVRLPYHVRSGVPSGSSSCSDQQHDGDQGGLHQTLQLPSPCSHRPLHSQWLVHLSLHSQRDRHLHQLLSPLYRLQPTPIHRPLRLPPSAPD